VNYGEVVQPYAIGRSSLKRFPPGVTGRPRFLSISEFRSVNRAVISRATLASRCSSRISSWLRPLAKSGRADHIEPSLVEKLTNSRCARTFVLRVWIAVGFTAD